MNGFHKRFYTLRTFTCDLKDLAAHIPALISTVRNKRISRPFAEKIMLSVASVNECSYCSYLHTKTALKGGVSEKEINKLLEQEIGDFSEDESVALAFAQHYAETEKKTDPEAERRFRSYYGPQISKDIVNYIRIVNFFTLVGNTAYAFLSRLRGKPAQKSNPLSEILILVICAPWAFLTLIYDIVRERSSRGRSYSL
ncbi:MAG: carboxymuconolactone decarboxylase family protein [Thermodesulfobacteriota bacterium]|nr:carboxymuconolactone decarboxylase family protein [Thermodesulfobacteriota bacterium]